MSYIPIARKWRPTSFSEIAGQSHVTQTLENALASGRVHHAFLFSGPRGVGKTTAARVLARALVCPPDARELPCTDCGCCSEIFAGTHPDVIEIDGASNNSVEDVRNLRDGVKYLPSRGSHKVYIVDEVHMLSKGAFNALLKTLEEPPSHVVFLFATTEPQKIPDTILSRVMQFDFKRIPTSVVVERLARICEAESLQATHDALRLLARAGDGSMRDSQSLLEKVSSFGDGEITMEKVSAALGLVDRSLLYAMLEGVIRADADQCLTAIHSVHARGYELTEFTAELLTLLHGATLLRLSRSARQYLDLSDAECDHIESLVHDIATDILVRAFQLLVEVQDQVARAPRPRLVLEMAVARLVHLRPAQPLDELVGQVADLERRLRHAGVSRGSRTPRSQRSPNPGRDDDDSEPAPAIRPEPPLPEPLGRPFHRAPGSPATPEAPEPTRSMEPPRPPEPPEAPEPTRSMEPPRPPEPPEAPESTQPPETGTPTRAESSTRTRPTPAEPAARPPQEQEEEATTRFLGLRKSLSDAGLAYDLWVEDAVLLKESPPVLRVVFSSSFKARRATNQASDPRLMRALSRWFPRCSRIEVGLRDPDSSLLSPREQLAQARKEELDAFRTEAENDPLVQDVCQVLGASLQEVGLEVPVEEPSP